MEPSKPATPNRRLLGDWISVVRTKSHSDWSRATFQQSPSSR